MKINLILRINSVLAIHRKK